MNLPFSFEEPFFDREVHAYDLRLAKALIKNMENINDIGNNQIAQKCMDELCECHDELIDKELNGTTETKQNQP